MCLGGFQCSWGKVYRFFPLKYTFITAVMLFEIGSLVCGVSQNSNTFIFGRAVAGVGGAGITTGVAVILALSAAPAKRPALMATMGLSYCIAFILGPLMGGIFSEKVTWRWCFYINLPIGSASIIMVWFFFHTPKSVKLEIAPWKEKLLHLDPVGIALVMGAITTFVLALESGGVKHPWNSSQVIGLLVGFVLMVAAFAVWEFVLQGDHAMLPRRLFKRRSLWAGSLFQFLFVGCYFLILFYLPIYFQSINGHSAVQSGVDTLPLVLTACVFIIVGGITVQKTRLATPYMAVGAAVTTVATGLFYTLDIGTPSARWIGFQILAAAGLAFPFQNVLNIVQAETDAEDISTATSSLYCMYLFPLTLKGSKLTEHSLPDSRWRIQRLSSPIGVLEQTHPLPYHQRARTRPGTGHPHGCLGPEGCLQRGTAPSCFAGVHGRSQGCLCGGHGHGWCCVFG